MRKRFGVVTTGSAVAALLAVPSVGSARTQVVWAGGPPKFQSSLQQKLGAEANDFFPRSVAIHVGDTISWQGMSINFHTIDLPGKSGKDLPLIVPSGQTTTGINDFAGSPFWFNGQPIVTINTKLGAPSGGNTYNGIKRVDAGVPLKAKPFKVKFTKPGTYVYFCDVHYDMRGIIVVRPKSTSVASAGTYAAQVATQVTRDTKEAKKVADTKVTGRVSMGVAGKFNVEVLAMFPSTLHVKTGSTVSFSMSRGTGETHTATFGPQAYLKPIVSSFAGFGPFDSRGAYSSSPPGSAIVISPTSHGNGFGNTGALDRDAGTPLPASAKVTFTTPGTYHYQCMIHPFMHGTIIVS